MLKPSIDTPKPFRDRLWSILVGVGLALSPIHNQWLTQLVTSNGEVGFFLPAFGTALWLMGSLAFLTWNWERIRTIGFGNKRVWIPLLVIISAIGLSGIPAGRWQDKISPLLMGISLFALYLSARVLGKSMLLPMAVGAGIASLGVIVHGILYPGQVTGGFVFEQNYDIVVGYILLGSALFIHKHQWMLAGLALVAILMSGSPEGLFATGALTVVALWRRDWSKKLVLAIAPTIVVLVVLFATGYGQKLYQYAVRVSDDRPSAAQIEQATREQAISYRLQVIGNAMTDIKPLGTGYNIADFTTGIVHNVPLIIVQQLGWPGVLAGLAWLWVTIYCLAKTKWKYVWVLVLSLSVFDHYIWSQLGPWYFAIVGITSCSNIDSDLIFKAEQILVKDAAKDEARRRYDRIIGLFRSSSGD